MSDWEDSDEEAGKQKAQAALQEYLNSSGSRGRGGRGRGARGGRSRSGGHDGRSGGGGGRSGRSHRPPRDFTFISGWVKYTMFFFNFLFWLLGGESGYARNISGRKCNLL